MAVVGETCWLMLILACCDMRIDDKRVELLEITVTKRKVDGMLEGIFSEC